MRNEQSAHRVNSGHVPMSRRKEKETKSNSHSDKLADNCAQLTEAEKRKEENKVMMAQKPKYLPGKGQDTLRKLC